MNDLHKIRPARVHERGPMSANDFTFVKPIIQFGKGVKEHIQQITC